jgi:hypothetical protein
MTFTVKMANSKNGNEEILKVYVDFDFDLFQLILQKWLNKL